MTWKLYIISNIFRRRSIGNNFICHHMKLHPLHCCAMNCNVYPVLFNIWWSILDFIRFRIHTGELCARKEKLLLETWVNLDGFLLDFYCQQNICTAAAESVHKMKTGQTTIIEVLMFLCVREISLGILLSKDWLNLVFWVCTKFDSLIRFWPIDTALTQHDYLYMCMWWCWSLYFKKLFVN